MGQDKKEVLEIVIKIMVGLGVFKEYSQGRLTQWAHYGERKIWAPFRPDREQWLWTNLVEMVGYIKE